MTATPLPTAPRRLRLPRLSPARLALLMIGLPMLLASLYFGLMAQDRYVSTSVMTVRRAQGESIDASGLALLLGGGGAAQEDVRLLRDYMHSEGLLHRLDTRFRLRAHYSAPTRDLLYRLPPDSLREDLADYWRARTTVRLDEVSGLLTVQVQAFDAALAQQLNAALLAESESFVNTVSQRIAAEQMRFAQHELERAEGELARARGALLDFQTRHRMLDPLADAQATGALAAELRAQLARVESELGTKQTYLNADAAELMTLRAQAAALRLQIERESRQATSARDDAQALNQLAAEFHALKAQATLAEARQRSALGSVEAMRIETSRKVRNLVVVEPPTRPERAEYPHALASLLTLLLSCLVLYGIVRLTLATVREHRD
ncbi:MAG: capsular polysaccharide transport system permease protein [Pseudomonadota bacterium]|nr:capsular polysaccharide transport system permease protein [Pseudomonadota bacterium]